MNFTSKGILRYSPKLLGNSSEKWWLVVDADPAIGTYYRHLYSLETHRCLKIQRPAWKEHISVIRNEEPPFEKQYLWGKYEGLEVEFEVVPGVQDNTLYYWLKVVSGFLLDVREELGLVRNPEYDLHVTIGNSVNV